MSDVDELYKDLKKYSDFARENGAENFLNTLEKIVLKGDANCISEIVKYFDDEAEDSWVFDSAIKAIEYFPDEKYVPMIIKNLSVLLKKAPQWADAIVNRIFNNDSCRRLFIENMHLAPKESLLKLFEVMEKESPHHSELIQELRTKI